jgi:hypothetical protein
MKLLTRSCQGCLNKYWKHPRFGRWVDSTEKLEHQLWMGTYIVTENYLHDSPPPWSKAGYQPTPASDLLKRAMSHESYECGAYAILHEKFKEYRLFCVRTGQTGIGAFDQWILGACHQTPQLMVTQVRVPLEETSDQTEDELEAERKLAQLKREENLKKQNEAAERIRLMRNARRRERDAERRRNVKRAKQLQMEIDVIKFKNSKEWSMDPRT